MRSLATHHNSRFQQALINWCMPKPGQVPADAAHVAQALERWLAEYPGNAGLIQELAAGAAAVAEVAADWSAAGRIAQVGLSASQVGALALPARQHTATLLALQAARAAMEMARMADARQWLEQASETLKGIGTGSVLTSYMNWQMHLLGGELSESALERSPAARHFDRAVHIARLLESDQQRLHELEAAWVEMLYHKLPQDQMAQATVLLASMRSDLRMRGVLGLARTSDSPAPAREAVDLCDRQNLPQRDPVLAMQSILGRLSPDELDDAADRLLTLARKLDEPRRTNWLIALHSQHAEAWLDHGDMVRAGEAVDAAAHLKPTQTDAISICLGLAGRVRLAIAQGGMAEGANLLDSLLRVRALTLEHLANSRWNLPLRAACDRALQAGVQAEAHLLHERDDAATRRRLSQLLDTLRSPEEGARADDLAADRLGRLASALARNKTAADWLVLVMQSVDEAMLLVAVGGDQARPVLVTRPERPLQAALRALGQRSAEALQARVEDSELRELGCAAYDALPDPVRQRLQHAGTLIVVPDLGTGQDSVPIELLHDGVQYLGVTKIVTRCLSLTHALRVVEAPLVMQPPGKHGLCVQVSQPQGWTPLQYADTEIRSVHDALVQQMWDVAELHEADADPQAVLELLPLAHLVHFACHGEAMAGAEALVLGGGARLTALEFGTRHPVRCVTYLNACSLARGRYLGGGISRGIAYAFARAGAPAVVANLAPVEDESAAQLAEAFYLAARGLPVGDALRRARQLLQSIVGPVRWSPTVLLGNPMTRLDGRTDEYADETSRLFSGDPLPDAVRMAAAKERLAQDPGDLRLAAAVRFSTTIVAGDREQWEPMANLAGEIGHDIGEAYCLVAWADALREDGNKVGQSAVLVRALSVLEPLRNAWKPAVNAHARLQRDLSELDPTYQARELEAVRLSSGMSVNDRSEPAVDAILSLFDAVHGHESFWRGGLRLHQPDLDVPSAAHNAVVWGHLHKLYGSGAEAAYAAQCAQRLAWRGLVPEACVSDLGRILAGLLHFLWGQQGFKHLERWMESAHTEVILLALRNVPHRWMAPDAAPGAAYARELSVALDQGVASTPGSRFTRAREALRGRSATTGAHIPVLAGSIGNAIEQCWKADPMASTELAAWIVGDVLKRIDAAESAGDTQLDAVHAYRSLRDALNDHEERWFMPYLMEGFKDVRKTGGQDQFDRWSRSMR